MNFNKVTVAGGGVLGTQIGLMCGYYGFDTTFWLRSESSITRTQPKIERYSQAILESLEKAKQLVGTPMGAKVYPRGLIRDWSKATVDSIDQLIAQAKNNFANKIHLETNMAKAISGAGLVIESMSENAEAKINVYTAMKDLLGKDTILCTNSSTMLPSTFAQYTGRPDKYCALHFANSIWINNTAEVMGHSDTDPKIYEEVVSFAEAIGMVPLKLHKEQPGYILNSMLVPFLESAQALLANEVADVETIDKTWRLGTGAPLGPFQILDIVGLETAYNINAMKSDAKVEGSLNNRVGKLLKEKIDKGETGVNAGKGFYDYTK